MILLYKNFPKSLKIPVQINKNGKKKSQVDVVYLAVRIIYILNIKEKSDTYLTNAGIGSREPPAFYKRTTFNKQQGFCLCQCKNYIEPHLLYQATR